MMHSSVRQVTGYPYRFPTPPRMRDRYPLLVPVLLILATLINWG